MVQHEIIHINVFMEDVLNYFELKTNTQEISIRSAVSRSLALIFSRKRR